MGSSAKARATKGAAISRIRSMVTQMTDLDECTCNQCRGALPDPRRVAYEAKFKEWEKELNRQIEEARRSEMITAEDLNIIVY